LVIDASGTREYRLPEGPNSPTLLNGALFLFARSDVHIRINRDRRPSVSTSTAASGHRPHLGLSSTLAEQVDELMGAVGRLLRR
jgi:hypothetical protein